MPRVSVLLPVYNGVPRVEVAVRSILEQTFTDFELIAVNDGSSDGTGDLLDRFAEADPRVRVIHQPNSGIVGALNRALSEAGADLVARMDADDESYPDRLAKQVAYMDARPEVGVLATYCLVEDVSWSGVSRAGETAQLVRWQLLLGNPITHPTVMMRRQLVREAGGYRAVAVHNEDYDLWVRLIDKCQIETLPEVLLKFNQTEGTNISSIHRDDQYRAAIDVQRRYMSKYIAVAVEQVQDLFDILHGFPLAERPNESPARRVHAAANLLIELRDVFVHHHPDASRAVSSDVSRHLVSLETALRWRAGSGRLSAALEHASWDRLAFLRSLPRRLVRAVSS